MAEITEKHAKRIHDLIKSKWAGFALLFAGCVFPLLSPVAIGVGLLYSFEIRRFLRLYPDMHPNQAAELQSARTTYLTMAWVHIGLWIAVAALVIVMAVTAE
ncbi:MAG: hypothetical protein WD534_14495 [Phycisphaeraceae bacterium]